jgi:hypothetical protein
MRDALIARFPSYAPLDALPLLAADRGIPSGSEEDPEVLRTRLILWLDALALSGLPIGLLLLLQAVLSPTYPLMRLVTQASLWYTLEEGAVGRMLALPGYEPLPQAPYEEGALWPTDAPAASGVERLRFSGLYERSQASPPNWDWDSLSVVTGTGYAGSVWLVVFSLSPTPWIQPDGMWGDPGVWGDGGAWGVDATPAIGRLLQAVAKPFKTAKAWVRWIVISFDGALFDPGEPSGGGVNPDGLFGHWSKIENRQYVRARFANARYGDGVT